MLQPRKPNLARESILAFGPYGSGKSNGWTSIAEMYRTTNTPGHFYVIETVHEASLVVLEPYDDWDRNVTVHEATGWDELLDVSAKIKDVATPEDWLVVESIGNTLYWSRDIWFTAARDGQTWKQFQTTGASVKDVKPHNWIEMDEIHRSWTVPFVQGFPGHKYATAQSDSVKTEQGFSDNKQIVAMFGRTGVKPIGHKDLGYVFRSVLLFKHPTKDTWTITTVDDPGREHVEDVQVAGPPLGFVKTVLMDVAGWTIT